MGSKISNYFANFVRPKSYTMIDCTESAAPRLIVMLTYDDLTVENAADVFDLCRDSVAKYWGMKEKPLPLEDMKCLFSHMKECGKTTVLEALSYDEEGAMADAQIAADCGCDILMGTKFNEQVCAFLHSRGIMYFPFVGEIEGRPSVLRGSIDCIVAEARDVVSRGADGIDLLGYRYVGDAPLLNKTLVSAIDAPVCIAGSIDSDKRLDEVYGAGAWGFTIGSAFFNSKFPGTISQQIDYVCRYLRKSDSD